MKNFDLSLFLGCCIIGSSIIISSIIISKNLPATTHVPSDLSITTSNAVPEFTDFLSESQVGAFLSISDEDVSTLITSGEFNSFATKIGDSYVFSKLALEGWMNDKIRGVH